MDMERERVSTQETPLLLLVIYGFLHLVSGWRRAGARKTGSHTTKHGQLRILFAIQSRNGTIMDMDI